MELKIIDISRNIFLIGFSGSGKSTVGPLLANLCKTHFVDTDSLIAKHYRKSIVRVFTEDGEKEFRETETDIIDKIANNQREYRVIALGGGAFERYQNRQMIMKQGVVVYLSCSVRELYRRLRIYTDRPLLIPKIRPGESRRMAIMRQIATLLNKRKKQYRMADIMVATTNRSPEEVTQLIMSKIRKIYA